MVDLLLAQGADKEAKDRVSVVCCGCAGMRVWNGVDEHGMRQRKHGIDVLTAMETRVRRG